MDILAIVKDVSEIALAIGSILIAYLLFKLNKRQHADTLLLTERQRDDTLVLAKQQRDDTLVLAQQQRDDSWKLALREIHKAFWDDDGMQQVRMWIDCDQAYLEDLKPVLAKRRAIKEGTVPMGELTREE